MLSAVADTLWIDTGKNHEAENLLKLSVILRKHVVIALLLLLSLCLQPDHYAYNLSFFSLFAAAIATY